MAGWHVVQPDLRQLQRGVGGEAAGILWGHCPPGNKCLSRPTARERLFERRLRDGQMPRRVPHRGLLTRSWTQWRTAPARTHIARGHVVAAGWPHPRAWLSPCPAGQWHASERQPVAGVCDTASPPRGMACALSEVCVWACKHACDTMHVGM